MIKVPMQQSVRFWDSHSKPSAQSCSGNSDSKWKRNRKPRCPSIQKWAMQKSHRHTSTHRKHTHRHTTYTPHITYNISQVYTHELSHNYPHVHRTLCMYEHICICLHILQCTHKHTTHSISHIYTLAHHPHAHNTNTLHTYIAQYGYTHITYNIYFHPHLQQITHMYTQHQYIMYTYIPHICTYVPSHSCT